MAVDSIRLLRKPFFMEVQIKDGYHLYRCFEGHLMLYLALFKECISTIVVANQSIEKEVTDAMIDGITIAENYKRETKAALVISHTKILQILNSLVFLKYQKQFGDDLKSQAKLLKNYVILQNSNNVYSCK